MRKIKLSINGHEFTGKKLNVVYISINANVIRGNAIHGTKKPPIRIARSQSDSKPTYAREIGITGPSKLLYSPDEPLLKCGARMVLVTCAEYLRVKK